MSNKVRCIGGTLEGDIRECLYPMFRVAKAQKIETAFSVKEPITQVEIEYETYTIEKIHGKNKDFYIAIHESLDIDDALERLIYLY